MGSGTYWQLVVAVTILLAVSATILGRNATDCSPREHLPCTVVKPGCVPDAKPPPEEGWPSKPKDLSVTVFMRHYPNPKYAGKKFPGLNITWRIPDNISFRYIQGFQLTLTIMSGQHVSKQICRTFNLSGAQWTSTDLKDKVMFYYEIYPCVRRTTFHVSLYSLPKSAIGHSDNYAYEYVVSPDIEFTNKPNPAKWVTAMSFSPDTASNRVDVWIMLAPPGYHFVHYDVMLINATQEGGRAANMWTHKTEVVVREGETGLRHIAFLNVCTGNYTVFVQPKNTGKYTPNCVCKNEHGACEDFCVASSSSLFTFVPGSPCHVTTSTTTTRATSPTTTTAMSTTTAIRPTTTTAKTASGTPRSTTPSSHISTIVPKPSPTGSNSSATPTTPRSRSPVTNLMSNQDTTRPDSGDLSGDKMAAIIVGVVLGIILMVILLFLVLRRSGYSVSGHGCNSCPPWKKPARTPPPTVTYDLTNLNNIGRPAAALEGVEITRKRRVLLVYANDHPLHLAVVHHLAQFLNANCACDVRFDQWSLDEIRRRSYVTWLWQEIDCAERIIIVNSLGAYRQHEAYKQNACYSNIADDSPPHDDGFLIAMETIKNRFGKALSCSYEKLIMVYFPYTSETHVLRDINPGHRYKLMKHIEDVVLHLHSLQRFNPDSVQSIGGGLNYAHYHQLIWGEALADSINKMAAYVSSQPNWFDQRFALFRSDSGFSSDGVETENLSDSPRDVSVGFSDADDISVVPPVLGDWLSRDISETVGEYNMEYEQLDYVSENPSPLDNYSIGGTSI